MVPGGGRRGPSFDPAGNHSPTGELGDCSGHRSGSAYLHQTGEARATGRRKSSRSQSSTGTRSLTRRPRIRERAVGVDLDHRHVGVLIDVLDGEHELAACTDLHLVAGLHGGAVSDRHDRTGRVVFPVQTIILAKLIFWLPAGRPVCDPAGSLTFRVGLRLLLRRSRRPLHPGEPWSRMGRNGNLCLADDAQVGAVPAGSRGAQSRRARARCPSHDHPVWSQSVPVRAPFRCAFVGHHQPIFAHAFDSGRYSQWAAGRWRDATADFGKHRPAASFPQGTRHRERKNLRYRAAPHRARTPASGKATPSTSRREPGDVGSIGHRHGCSRWQVPPSA